MTGKNLFNEDTMILTGEDKDKTRKKAKINIDGVPQLQCNGKTKRLNSRAFSIGRDKRNGLILADPKASKFHAMVTFSKGVGYLTDTQSTNGTLLNGKKMAANRKTALKNGDKIKIGTTLIVYRFD